MDVRDLLPILLPLVAIQLGLQIFSLFDLARAERHARYLPKVAWAAIIILGQLLGSVVYLVAGREEA
ncbi:MAG: PLDc N-terminal domain-containing protein [Thermomicrobiales bacterium]